MILIHTDIYYIYPFPETIRLLQSSWLKQTFNEWFSWKNQAETTSPRTSSTTKCLDHFFSHQTKLIPGGFLPTFRQRILFILQWRSSETKKNRSPTISAKRGPFRELPTKDSCLGTSGIHFPSKKKDSPGVIQVGRVWSTSCYVGNKLR